MQVLLRKPTLKRILNIKKRISLHYKLLFQDISEQNLGQNFSKHLRKNINYMMQNKVQFQLKIKLDQLILSKCMVKYQKNEIVYLLIYKIMFILQIQVEKQYQNTFLLNNLQNIDQDIYFIIISNQKINIFHLKNQYDKNTLSKTLLIKFNNNVRRRKLQYFMGKRNLKFGILKIDKQMKQENILNLLNFLGLFLNHQKQKLCKQQQTNILIAKIFSK
ncbi:unnamed protein product [Paramecium sonneborni]|uniref:Uncharacterized protein n=1 Tax=Paramecium sonneborni TaxID=65129 RepID=A0A8S1RLV8_9CILI|nr:unnamed protein product [Paramecium sonneborni]